VKRWFERLPIHRKLVTSALLITAAGLVVAMVGLSAFDVWRYRRTATDDAEALARVLAEHHDDGRDIPFGRNHPQRVLEDRSTAQLRQDLVGAAKARGCASGDHNRAEFETPRAAHTGTSSFT